MAAHTITCSGCENTWSYLNTDDVEEALTGLTTVKSHLGEAEKKINNANENCGEKEFNFGGVTMVDTFSVIIKSTNFCNTNIDELSSTIMEYANAQSATQEAAAREAKRACEAAHLEEAASKKSS